MVFLARLTRTQTRPDTNVHPSSTRRLPTRASLGYSVAAGLIGLGLLSLTLRSTPTPNAGLVDEVCAICGERAVADFVVNILMFVPLGLALALGGAGPRTRWIIPLSLAVGIEIAQLGIPGRFSTLSDLTANTLGGLAGSRLPDLWRWWVRDIGSIGLRTVLAAGLSALIVLAGAVLHRPDPVPEPDYFHWVPHFDNLELWTGAVLEARIGDRALDTGWLPDTSSVGAALADGAPLSATLRAGEPSTGFAPILALTDPEERVTFEVGVLGRAVLVRSRRIATQARFENAATRFDDAFAETAPGDTVSLAVTSEGRSTCLAVDAGRWCVPLPAAAGVWRHFYAPDSWSRPVRAALDLLSLALLAFPAALLGAGTTVRVRVAALLVGLGGLCLSPLLGPVSPPGSGEVGTLVMALACWGWVGARARRSGGDGTARRD
jgi:hypothetical protein